LYKKQTMQRHERNRYPIQIKILDCPWRSTNTISITMVLDPKDGETFDGLLRRVKTTLSSSRHHPSQSQLNRYTHFKTNSLGSLQSEYLGELRVMELWEPGLVLVMATDPPDQTEELVDTNEIGEPQRGDEQPPSRVGVEQIVYHPLPKDLPRPSMAWAGDQGPSASEPDDWALRQITYLDLATYNTLCKTVTMPEYKAAKNLLLNYYQVLLGKELPEFVCSTQGRDHQLRFFMQVEVTDLVETNPKAKELIGKNNGIPYRFRGYGVSRRKTEAENLAAVHAIMKLQQLGIDPPCRTPRPKRGARENFKAILNELYQFHFRSAPKFHTAPGPPSLPGSVRAWVEIKGVKFEAVSWSISKASQQAAEQAVAHLRATY
jgi:dsRNA-specific ribonuclease